MREVYLSHTYVAVIVNSLQPATTKYRQQNYKGKNDPIRRVIIRSRRQWTSAYWSTEHDDEQCLNLLSSLNASFDEQLKLEKRLMPKRITELARTIRYGDARVFMQRNIVTKLKLLASLNLLRRLSLVDASEC